MDEELQLRDKLANELLDAIMIKFPNIKDLTITFDANNKGTLNFDDDNYSEKEVEEFINTFRSEVK